MRAGFIHNSESVSWRGLHRQLFPAAAAAGCQNTAAVLRGHPGAESVHLAALALLGLIRTEHCQHSLSNSFVQRGLLPREIYRTALTVYRSPLPLSRNYFDKNPRIFNPPALLCPILFLTPICCIKKPKLTKTCPGNPFPDTFHSSRAGRRISLAAAKAANFTELPREARQYDPLSPTAVPRPSAQNVRTPRSACKSAGAGPGPG